MKAMVLERARTPLQELEIPRPEPGAGQVLLEVLACAVCRTDLHIVDGELTRPKLPLVIGHEIVGKVRKTGDGVQFRVGERVGVPWLGWTCGVCVYCTTGRENLCDQARFTGYDINGGYAEYCVADARYCFPIPSGYDDAHAAPLLCAGLIGYRALRTAGEPADAKRLGIYGFGAAAHLVAPESAGALADAIERAITQGDSPAVTAARRNVVRRFSLERRVEAHLKLYRELLEAQAGVTPECVALPAQ